MVPASWRELIRPATKGALEVRRAISAGQSREFVGGTRRRRGHLERRQIEVLMNTRLGVHEHPASWFERLDRRITTTLAAAAIPLLRIALGAVFLWFGVLKFVPGLSPAQDLAARTIEVLTLGVIPPAVAVPVLAGWEVLIGLGLLTGRFLRATLAALAVQMLGTFTPLVLFPAETFTVFPIAPTLEGQYIIKNVVLVAAAMVVGATVRGGELRAEASPGTQPTGPTATTADAMADSEVAA
jgi:uncharacterized membrane protein YphA (DoxX/SURF4 family)